MATQTKPNRFYKLLLAMTVVLFACMYSCNNTTDKKEEAPAGTPKDTAAAVAPDTTHKMSADTAKKDTSGKGDQKPPPAH